MKAKALILAFVIMGGASVALGATATGTLNVNSTVSARASLVLGSASINFPDADPSTVFSIPATENPVAVTASVRTGAVSSASLQVLAAGDLTSGSNVIAISNVTWTAGGSGFTGGTMNKTTAQSAGTWTGSGQRTSSFSYFLANSWNYSTGSYVASLTYTLTAP